MTEAKCTRCGGTASGDSFDDARAAINHAPGLSRGIKCGDNCNCVVIVADETYKKVEGKSTEKIKFDESKSDQGSTTNKTIKSKHIKE